MADVSIRESIIAQMGAEGLTENVRVQLVAQMTELAERRVMLRLLEELPNEHLERARELESQPTELLAFLAQHSTNVMRIIQQEVEAVRSASLLAADTEAPFAD